ncbi:MAG TPA: hypothetical protein VK846_16740 [Candidatus Limnocylindria bacterium]|nr:hypothetical protein [Candidatus Limnocylindria bacterium]
MEMAAQQRVTPGRRWYLVVALLIALAIFGVPGCAIWFVFNQPKPTPFLSPGPLDFTARQAGKHTLWHEYDTIFNGVMYSSNVLLSGFQIHCRDGRSGAEIPVVSDRGAVMSTSNVRRESVAAVKIPAPGRYLVSVEGSPQPMLFSFGPAILGKVMGSIFGALPVAFVFLAGGVAFAANIFVRRNRALRAVRPETSVKSN